MSERNQPNKPTPEANSERINGLEDLLVQLNETTESMHSKDRWFVGIALTIALGLAGAWAKVMLSKVDSIESRVAKIEVIQTDQATSMARFEVKFNYADRLESQMEKLESRIFQLERASK